MVKEKELSMDWKNQLICTQTRPFTLLVSIWFIGEKHKTKTAATECTRGHITKGTLDRFTLPSNSRLTQFIVFCGEQMMESGSVLIRRKCKRQQHYWRLNEMEYGRHLVRWQNALFGRGSRWTYFGLRASTHNWVEAVCVWANELIFMELLRFFRKY